MRKSILLCFLVFCMFFAIGYRTFGQDEDHSCWGSGYPCEDGKYYDKNGKEQPKTCDNFSATGKAEVHTCDCNKTKSCNKTVTPGPQCKTYCQKDACSCVRSCS